MSLVKWDVSVPEELNDAAMKYLASLDKESKDFQIWSQQQ